MAFPLRHLSPTQLRSYDACPLQYRYRYIDKLRTGYHPASLLGEAVHQALESTYAHKKSTNSDLSLEDALEVFETVWDDCLPGSALEGEDAGDFATARDDGIRLLTYYLKEVAPSVIPHLVEYRFRFDVPGLPVPVVGTVDLIDRNGVVIDHKTSRRPFNPDYLASDLQLMCYAIAYGAFRAGSRLRPGTLPSPYFLPDVRVDVLIPSDPPVLQQLTATYGHDELAGFLRRSQAIAHGIEAGAYPAFWSLPDRPHDSAVCARCPYAELCDQSLLEPGDDDRKDEEQK